jgi:hypothetical protein
MNELTNSIDCYRISHNDKDVGGILITTGTFGRTANQILLTNQTITGWDLKYIIFLSVMVSNYGNRFIKNKLYTDDYTYIVSTLFPPLPRNLMIFYDADTPLNVNKIKEIIKRFSMKIGSKFSSYNHIEFHSLNGFTSDVHDYFRKYSNRFCGFSLFKIKPHLFIDYKFPWEVILKFDLIYPSYFYSTHRNIKIK